MYAICNARAETYRTEVFQSYQPTYEEALAEIVENADTVIKQLTAAKCTVVYSVNGSPQGSCYSLHLVWFSGKTKKLPLPYFNAWCLSAEPDDVYLSEDKNTLYYQVTFAEKMVTTNAGPTEVVIHEKGTYRYSVDLATGDVSLTITDK